jgi:hypothetical protein
MDEDEQRIKTIKSELKDFGVDLDYEKTLRLVWMTSERLKHSDPQIVFPDSIDGPCDYFLPVNCLTKEQVEKQEKMLENGINILQLQIEYTLLQLQVYNAKIEAEKQYLLEQESETGHSTVVYGFELSNPSGV